MKRCLLGVVVLLSAGANAQSQLDQMAQQTGVAAQEAPAKPKQAPAANCPSGQFVHVDKLRARGLSVTELTPEAEKNLVRYLDKTQGTPPDLSKIPGYKIFFSHDKSAAFVENGHYVTPPSQGAIAILQSTCLVYRVDGTTEQLGHILAGTWSLSTQ